MLIGLVKKELRESKGEQVLERGVVRGVFWVVEWVLALIFLKSLRGKNKRLPRYLFDISLYLDHPSQSHSTLAFSRRISLCLVHRCSARSNLKQGQWPKYMARVHGVEQGSKSWGGVSMQGPTAMMMR